MGEKNQENFFGNWMFYMFYIPRKNWIGEITNEWIGMMSIYMGMGQNPGTPGEPQNSWVKMDVNNPLKMYL